MLVQMRFLSANATDDENAPGAKERVSATRIRMQKASAVVHANAYAAGLPVLEYTFL